jgi:hypothetical protein
LTELRKSERLERAKKAALKILSSYPDYGKVPASYVAALVEVLKEYSESVIIALEHPTTGIRGKCKYLPTVADIVEVADELSKPRRNPFEIAPPFPGRNFTQERLAEEEAMRAKGIEPPKVEYKSRERIEHPGDHDPHWLTHPDPNAPWRKQGPPSRELAKLLADDPDYQANLARWRANNPTTI